MCVCVFQLACREDEDDALRQLMGDGEDEIPKVRIEDLVNEMLTAGKHSLSLLTESEVAQVRTITAMMEWHTGYYVCTVCMHVFRHWMTSS